MSVARWKWAGVAALLTISGAGLFTVYADHAISLTQEQAQTRLDRQIDRDFPVRGAALAAVNTVRATKAQAHIADNRVSFLVDVTGALRNDKEFSLTANATGVPRFENGAFYFIEDKAQQAEDWTASITQEVVKEALATHPVYRVGDDTKGAIIKASLNSVRVVNDHIEASFSLWRLTTSVIAGACGLVMAIALGALMLKYANSGDVSASIIPDP